MEIVGQLMEGKNVALIVTEDTKEHNLLQIKFNEDKHNNNLTFYINRTTDTEKICHASIQSLRLVKTDTTTAENEFWLIGIVRKKTVEYVVNNTHNHNNGKEFEVNYFASLLLVHRRQPMGQPKIIEKVEIVEPQKKELKLHLLPNFNKDENCVPETSSSSSCYSPQSFKNRLILLRLNECVMVYTIETVPFSSSQAHLEILSSECVTTRCFWWAQWVPQHKFLAFAHTRKVQQSSFDDDEDPLVNQAKPVLSVLQFHDKFQNESVLNMPLKVELNSEAEALHLQKSYLVQNPMVCSSSAAIGLKILAHSSGAVHLFHLRSKASLVDNNQHGSSTRTVSYSINLLHHNRQLHVDAKLHQVEYDISVLKVDACLYSNGQYVLVVGWPFFIHVLDVGITHEPSHHLIFDLVTLMPPSLPFFSLCASQDLTMSNNNGPDSVKFLFEDFSSKTIEINSAMLLPLMKTKDINFKLAVLHLLLVHLGDINAAKRIVYDSAKDVENLYLKKIFQEFLVGSSYLQSKKQLTTNLESFLLLIPYSPQLQFQDFEDDKVSITCQPNPAAVTTMLLSPSQRVFPHNITDVWTRLWEIHQQLGTKYSRFNHKKIADKLFLSLQCYKPEALSRASTPMSPSSPMVCVSIGDIAGMFSRRMQELQLPFLEHESCTANKQEYIFSINLRELSMHLLKERKEWPLLGHTVAAKYVNALVDTARLLCHLICLTLSLQPTKNRDKGFRLIDSLDWETKLKLFMLFEHYSLAVGELACPLPQGFTPFFAYLGYRVVPFDQFLWHVRSGSYELHIDLVKTIMADLNDADEDSVGRKLHLISLLPRSRANRVLCGWSHPSAICIRARQHASDLLSGVAVSQMRKSVFVINRKKKGDDSTKTTSSSQSPLDMFFKLLTLKAGPDIDLGLLTEATLLTMEAERQAT